MHYFGKVFVEFWDNNEWKLSAVWFWQYWLMRLWGYCGGIGASKARYNYIHVPRKNIRFT